MKNDYAKLIENLNKMNLKYIADTFKCAAVEAVSKNIDHIGYLESLIEGEASRKEEISIRNRIKNAKFPCRKTLEEFNWSHPSKINRMQIENIFRLDFIEQNENILILGPCGVGKSHIMNALAEKACVNNYSVLFASAINIINVLTAAKATNTLDKEIKRFFAPRVLAIDEVGYLPIDQLGSDLLFQVISGRYERGGSILLTTNVAFKEWHKIFNNDKAVTSAALDRLFHHSQVITIEGKSYRLKDKIKE